MDFKILAKNLGLDLEIFLDLIDTWILSVSNEILNSVEAKSKLDYKTIESSMHKIKGASLQLGFNELAEIAKKIESDAKNNCINNFDENLKLLKDKFEVIRNLRNNL